ncbi:MAG: NusA-like transcription termination signal-binding factor [DPANN group archaeon]|nr:NusA-like transcription termination signal-binding factor [DPANN group archaeon]
MVSLKFDSDTLQRIQLFKQVTRIDCKDCFEFNDYVIFITMPRTAGLAIGKAGENVKRLRTNLGKTVKIIDEAETPEDLIMNFLYPMQPLFVKIESRAITSPDGTERRAAIANIKFANAGERRALLGNNLANLKLLKFVVKRYFPDIEDIMVLQ